MGRLGLEGTAGRHSLLSWTERVTEDVGRADREQNAAEKTIHNAETQVKSRQSTFRGRHNLMEPRGMLNQKKRKDEVFGSIVTLTSALFSGVVVTDWTRLDTLI